MEIITDNYILYKDDCLNILKTLPSESIDLVLIDPPYNIGKDKKWDKWKTVDGYVSFMGEVFKECERVLKDNGSFYFFHNDFLQIVALQNFINENTKFVFKQLLIWNKTSFKKFAWTNRDPEKCKDRNWFPNVEYCLYYTFQDETGLKSIYSNKDCFKELREYAYNIRKYINYSRERVFKILGHRGAQHFLEPYGPQWDICTEETYNQLIDIFNIDRYEEYKTYEELRREYEKLRQEYEKLRQEYEELRYTFNLKEVQDNISCVWESSSTNSGKLHSCQKPLDILEKIIKTSSNDGDVVLDCFMGSGSTGVACLNLNRKFIGIEKEKKYFNISKNRLEDAKLNNRQKKLF